MFPVQNGRRDWVWVSPFHPTSTPITFSSLCLCLCLSLSVCLSVCLSLVTFPPSLSPWYNRTGWLGVKHQLTLSLSFSLSLSLFVSVSVPLSLSLSLSLCLSVCLSVCLSLSSKRRSILLCPRKMPLKYCVGFCETELKIKCIAFASVRYIGNLV